MWAPEPPAPGRAAGTAHPWSSGTSQCLTHVWKGLQRLSVWVHPLVLTSPIVLLDVAAPECPTDHSPHVVGGLGASGPAYTQNTPWRSQLQGAGQHFHVVAVIKRLLESRERRIPPMDSSGL